MPKDECDPEDPNELVGVPFAGTVQDEEAMALAIIDEYVRFGTDREGVIRLFRDPFFRMSHGIYLRRGEDFVLNLVDTVFAQWNGGVACPR
jgi:hypothetical protein